MDEMPRLEMPGHFCSGNRCFYAENNLQMCYTTEKSVEDR